MYYWYARTFRWPPEVVRKLSIKEDYWLRAQEEAAKISEETLTREQERQLNS